MTTCSFLEIVNLQKICKVKSSLDELYIELVLNKEKLMMCTNPSKALNNFISELLDLTYLLRLYSWVKETKTAKVVQHQTEKLKI